MNENAIPRGEAPPHNIASQLPLTAAKVPFQRAVVFPESRDRSGRVAYTHWTFRQLDQISDRYAHGLGAVGIERGMRTLLMVRPSLEFIGLTFALFKVGAVPVLIDPGMGRRNLLGCLSEVEPEGLVGIPLAHALKSVYRSRFPKLRVCVTVGRRWFWGGTTLREITPDVWEPFSIADTSVSDPAAIIFTTGSTGAPKGVCYQHGMFIAQVEWLRDAYHIEPGEVDVAGFPLFALFNAALGVTTVIPDMNPTRPGSVNPKRFVEAIVDQGATQSFGSPAIWNRVGRYCVEKGIKLPSLKRVLMAGAAVAPRILRDVQAILNETAAAHTPYGATESLPVATIDSHEVLGETAAKNAQGLGACVGKPFPKIRVRIIPIRDEPIATWSEDLPLPPGEIGEIAVHGAVVTREYFARIESTRWAKIHDGDSVWHRMGDVGYFDDQGRLWYCGRMAHRVQSATGVLFTECCEPIFNQHPRVFRSALVGVGAAPKQTPVIIIEPHPEAFPLGRKAEKSFRDELLALGAANPKTQMIHHILFKQSFPVDIRHNAKIFREKLAPWAAKRLG